MKLKTQFAISAAIGGMLAISIVGSAQTHRPISTGQKVALSERLTPEQPTVFVFLKTNSSLERDFLKELYKVKNDKSGLETIELKTGLEPIAKQYDIKETPTAIVFDRRGRMAARSSKADEISAAVKKAAGVMRIDWAEEGDANYLDSVRLIGRSPGVGILRTMTLQPEYLKLISELSQKAHFSDGFLKRRVKEMIATYVSEINHCKFWTGAHARFLQLQGQDEKDVDLLGTGHRELASFSSKEQALLDYVKVLTLTPAKVKDSDVERLRTTGWNDNEIFEASFITSFFAFFNRMADAYGLDYDPVRWLPPERRLPLTPAGGKLIEPKPKK